MSIQSAVVTPGMLARTLHVIRASGILALLLPAPKRGPGRKGNLRLNVFLLIVGMRLCVLTGRETSIAGIHTMLTTGLSRQDQWDLGVLRPLTSKSLTERTQGSTKTVNVLDLRSRKSMSKARDAEAGYETVSQQDLHRASQKIRDHLDHGKWSAAKLSVAERDDRARVMARIVDGVLRVTTIGRLGTTFAIDATGIWSWRIGKTKRRKQLEELAKKGKVDFDLDIVVEDIAPDVDEGGTPTDVEIEYAVDDAVPEGSPGPAMDRRDRGDDGEWGYKTAKDGGREVGYGFTSTPSSAFRTRPTRSRC
ncbi:hypothetical protein KIN34_14665 [Cellulomonas sp. DKR-3]|uniref:Uncharacterized protein n=1 Tax=Cellulomonas fulva TaxID=2835530 RepID=A0ABS5U2C1_9CELL|nr:hypothetical protein [Cellulomonas fulva]MBT0995525.1 hypothetical protein [Cellulomonas fulva]